MNKNVAKPSSFHLARACLAAALFLVGIAQSLAQGTAFTYQGYLESGSAPADGNFDFRFTLKSAATGGSTIGSARTVINHGVTSGVFTQDLDFGDRAFDGSERYLEGHDNSNTKKKDGWLRDLGKNTQKAMRRGMKELKVRT